ncbi:MAG: hypothetical protein II329_02815, partial [Clostridia bacterium]|nr:hypothetical protein [Clostridia bacterium]
PRYEADEDVLYLNNIVVLFSHQSPIFHNKAILSFIYSLVSEHPHPSLRATFSLLEKAYWFVTFDGAGGTYALIGILIRRFALPCFT